MQNLRAPLSRLADQNDSQANMSQPGVQELIKQLADKGINLTEQEADKLIDDQFKQEMKKAVTKEAAHPKEWWTEPGHPERQRLLREVMLEVDNDSEDERGRPVYIKERCPLFKEYMAKIA
jgi:hypothetical protein